MLVAIKAIFLIGSPAQVFDSVVSRVSVYVTNDIFIRRTRSDKDFKNELVHSRLWPLISWISLYQFDLDVLGSLFRTFKESSFEMTVDATQVAEFIAGVIRMSFPYLQWRFAFPRRAGFPKKV